MRDFGVPASFLNTLGVIEREDLDGVVLVKVPDFDAPWFTPIDAVELVAQHDSDPRQPGPPPLPVVSLSDPRVVAAIEAMAALLPDMHEGELWASVAQRSVDAADALMAELAKEKG